MEENTNSIDVTVPVVLTINTNSEDYDNLAVAILKNALKDVENSAKTNFHPQDIKYDKKLIKALKRVIRYYGEA